MNTEIKKGIEYLLEQVTPLEIEEKSIYNIPDRFKPVLEDYEFLLQRENEKEFYGRDGMIEAFTDLVNLDFKDKTFAHILTPGQIKAFTFLTTHYDQKHNYNYKTGLFLNKLIQNSYGGGYNDFYIHAQSRLDWLGFCLRGTAERPIHLHVDGKTGYTGCEAKYIIVELSGECEGIGTKAQQSIFTINTTIKSSQDAPEGLKSRECLFRTSNKETLKTFKKIVPPGNKIIFLQPNGTEQVVRDYA